MSQKYVPGHALEGDEYPLPRPFPKWLTFERATTMIALIFAAGCYFTSVTNLDKRVTKLEDRTESTNNAVHEIKSDVKVLLERTDTAKKH